MGSARRCHEDVQRTDLRRSRYQSRALPRDDLLRSLDRLPQLVEVADGSEIHDQQSDEQHRGPTGCRAQPTNPHSGVVRLRHPAPPTGPVASARPRAPSLSAVGDGGRRDRKQARRCSVTPTSTHGSQRSRCTRRAAPRRPVREPGPRGGTFTAGEKVEGSASAESRNHRPGGAPATGSRSPTQLTRAKAGSSSAPHYHQHERGRGVSARAGAPTTRSAAWSAAWIPSPGPSCGTVVPSRHPFDTAEAS